jgi:predicted transcriptional regulator
MPDETSSLSVHRELATKIAAYVRRNQVASDQLGTLISTVHQAFSGLGKPVAEVSGGRTPAVTIRRSVHRDYVVCLECGWRGQMLRRHLATGHGLTVAVSGAVEPPP